MEENIDELKKLANKGDIPGGAFIIFSNLWQAELAAIVWIKEMLK